MARKENIPVQRVDRQRLDKFAPETAHQGVVALAAAREYVEVEDIILRNMEYPKHARNLLLEKFISF